MAKIQKALTRRSAAVAIVAAVLARSPGVGAQSAERNSATAEDDRRAATYVAQAKAALAAGNAHEALRDFRDAWNVAKTPEIAGNLATIEASFGHHRDAAEHFQFALSHLPPDATTEQKQAVAAGLDTEKQQVVTLVVRGAPVGARLSIDGQVFGTAPYTDNLYVDIGRHDVRAEAPGYQSLTQTIGGSVVGTTLAVQLALRPLEAPAPEALAHGQAHETAVPPVLHTAGKPSPVVLVVGGGATLVGAALGAVSLVKRKTALQNAANERDALPGDNACGSNTPHVSECKTLHDTNVAIDRDRNVAAASFVVGGAAAVGTLVYWFWPRSQAPTEPMASAIVIPGYAAVQARWSW